MRQVNKITGVQMGTAAYQMASPYVRQGVNAVNTAAPAVMPAAKTIGKTVGMIGAHQVGGRMLANQEANFEQNQAQKNYDQATARWNYRQPVPGGAV
jgi:uncharacterized protein YccT (UPF0319 family)